MYPNIFDKSISPAEVDVYFMKEAIKEAKKAFDENEVPVGAVVVYDNRIIARAHNQTELLNDATAHAEMLCISAANSYFNNFRLDDTTIYTTLEPCAMCASAMFLARIKRLVWSAKDLRLGANGSFIDLFSLKHPIHSIEVKSNVLEADASELMKDFFRKIRYEKDKANH
jgi:tRNA(adenine34) deaminase